MFENHVRIENRKMKTKDWKHRMKLVKRNRYIIFILIIFACVFQYGIGKICGFTLYPDEFGYWASAARVVGYDWSEVASLGSYYSFGYSLMLIPVLLIFKDGILAYKAAVLINILLMIAGFFTIQRITATLFPKMDKGKMVFISAVAVCYPPWIFYSQMTMSEALLCFVFLLIVFFFCRFVKKPGIVSALCLSVLLIYIYCVHMRTVGIVIACVITLLMWKRQIFPDKKALTVFLLGFLIAAAGAIVLKKCTVTEVFSYADSKMLMGNDYGSQWHKFQEILTIDGFSIFIKGLLGKVYYMGVASFGLFYWAFAWCMNQSRRMLVKLQKRKKTEISECVGMFLLLAVIGELLISSVFMYKSSVIDCLVYGRYTDFLVPILMVIGIVAMSKCRGWFWLSIFIGLWNGFLTMVLLNFIDEQKLLGIRGYHIAGISYLLNENSQNVKEFFWNTWWLGFIAVLVTAGIIRLAFKWNTSEFFLVILLFVEIFAGLQISEHYTYRVNNANFEDRVIVDAISEQIEEENNIYYLNEGSEPFIDYIQMQFPEESIHVIKEADVYKKKRSKHLLVTSVDTKLEEELINLYDKKVQGTTFCLYLNENTKED